MEDEELKTKKNYSAIKDPNEDEKQGECVNLLSTNDKNLSNSTNNFHLANKKTYNYGKNKILFYYNGEPLIVLGPHCKN